MDRQEYILDYLKKHEFADVVQLSRELDVSEMTIRRDFGKLESKHRIIRVHGGAVLRPTSTYEAPLSERRISNLFEKQSLGRYAASFVEEGDVIALDASSTVLTMLEYLDKRVTVVTNNMQVAVALMGNEKVDVTLLGGTVRKSSASTVGLEAVQMMRRYHVEKLFFSSKAIDIVHGVTDATVVEAEVKKTMLECCEHNYLLMDQTKLNQCAFYKVCDVVDCHDIVVNKAMDYSYEQEAFLKACAKSGAQLHFAE